MNLVVEFYSPCGQLEDRKESNICMSKVKWWYEFIGYCFYQRFIAMIISSCFIWPYSWIEAKFNNWISIEWILLWSPNYVTICVQTFSQIIVLILQQAPCLLLVQKIPLYFPLDGTNRNNTLSNRFIFSSDICIVWAHFTELALENKRMTLSAWISHRNLSHHFIIFYYLLNNVQLPESSWLKVEAWLLTTYQCIFEIRRRDMCYALSSKSHQKL